MPQHYRHLGEFSDWVAAAQQQQALWPLALPGPDTQARVREVLGFCNGDDAPQDVRIERQWQTDSADGLIGEEISWSVGFGPRTKAWLFKPAHANGPLPGILALHDHGGFKFYGKEKISAGPDVIPPVLKRYHERYYGGRAYVNALAQEGFAVLVHDALMWGSRKFAFASIPKYIRDQSEAAKSTWQPTDDTPYEIAEYNAAAAHHEHLVAKYANVLGSNLAGMVCHEDRVALNYLRSRTDIDSTRVGCIGLSGGGNRAAMLNATHNGISAAVIVGLMSTYAALLDHNMSHTWMLFPNDWSRYGDWPDLAACRAPSPLLVQYDEEDELFTPQGMRDAHIRLRNLFASTGQPDAYDGQFYPGPHKFDLIMQRVAFDWLKQKLSSDKSHFLR